MTMAAFVPLKALLLLLLLVSCHAWSLFCRQASLYSKSTTRLLASTSTESLPPSQLTVDPAADDASALLYRLQGKLLKQVRKLSKEYNMLEEGDHLMVCVSGGKDSATMLHLLRALQQSLPISFRITAVHVDQKQPGYNGTTLIQWLQHDLQVDHYVIEEDTYSIVVEKTLENKSYCTMCSRLRRGILYTTAEKLGCNKICLGHHGDDALETLLLNMIHSGQLKGMPARYTAKRGHNLAVMRPLLTCLEEDIQKFASLKQFPILPCNLCSNQANLQRPQIKLLLSTLEGLAPDAKKTMITAMSDIRPSHLMDRELRKSCGLDPVTGESIRDDVREGGDDDENEAV